MAYKRSYVGALFGAGVHDTAFFDERSGAPNSIDDDNRSGAALQTGEDVAISAEWFVNADVKTRFLDSDVSGTTAGGASVNADVGLGCRL